jgi:hypothetical protein
MIIPVPLGPHSDPARSTNVGVGLLTNCYVEAAKQGKAPFAIYGDMGLENFVESFGNEGSIRGGALIGSALYIVAGESLYRVTSDGTATLIGDIFGERSVIFARNAATPIQAVIVADSIVYLLTIGSPDTLVVHPDNDLPAGIVSAASMSQRIVFLHNDGSFFWSDVLDASAVDALSFDTAEARPDGGERNIVLGNEMWIIGTETTEVFGSSTDTNNPFPRVTAGILNVGTPAKHSVDLLDNSLVWVDNKSRVVRPEGFNPQRISNHAVEANIQADIDAQVADQIEGFTFTDGGHEYYQVSGSNWTWIYDAASGLWHAGASHLEPRSRRRHYFRAFDRHIVGDYESAKLYRMAHGIYDEAGTEFIMGIRSQCVYEPGAYTSWNRLWFDIEMGVGSGASTSPEFNPRCMLRWSDDGGKTWSQERERPLGQAGQYKGRVQFNGLGMSKEHGRSYELRISAAVKRAVISASADVVHHYQGRSQ